MATRAPIEDEQSIDSAEPGAGFFPRPSPAESRALSHPALLFLLRFLFSQTWRFVLAVAIWEGGDAICCCALSPQKMSITCAVLGGGQIRWWVVWGHPNPALRATSLTRGSDSVEREAPSPQFLWAASGGKPNCRLLHGCCRIILAVDHEETGDSAKRATGFCACLEHAKQLLGLPPASLGLWRSCSPAAGLLKGHCKEQLSRGPRALVKGNWSLLRTSTKSSSV